MRVLDRSFEVMVIHPVAAGFRYLNLFVVHVGNEHPNERLVQWRPRRRIVGVRVQRALDARVVPMRISTPQETFVQ